LHISFDFRMERFWLGGTMRRKIYSKANLVIALLTIGSGLEAAQGATGRFIPNNTPKFVTTAKNLGPEDPAKIIDVSIWLNPHNRGALDALAHELYDSNSTNYHRWLQRADLAAKFAPTIQEAQAVQHFFVSHNLRVVSVGPDNFFVRAQGTVADVQRAFRVAINKFDVDGTTYRANTADPYVDGTAAGLVRAVSGLNNVEFQHPLMTQSLKNRSSTPGLQSASAAATAAFFTSDCFTGVKTEHYSNDGTFPVAATYRGNTYTSSIEGCGYTPPEIQTAYHLTDLYRSGFDGTGQTIVIIDWCGSPTILQDANAFSARFGLPPLTSSNFHIINPSTPPTCGAVDPEINIDVEWAHAIAPGASIDLVVPPSASFQDVDIAELYAIANGLGNVISGSYGSPESFTDPAELNQENLLNELAAVLGISANFSTGDLGDFTPFGIPPTVSAPADSPFATAIGGVSLALKSDNTIAFQTGWGNNVTELVFAGLIDDPPFNFGFNGGSGGGPSAVFLKPSFQNRLPGRYRQLPDISWLADPFTGGVIAITEPFVFPPLEWQVWGGTSLSCPMFSALWAIANQEAGAPLGQAAPYLYSMPAGTIKDVIPVSSPTNVTATIDDPFGTTHYSAADLAEPLDGTTRFYSALWDLPLRQDTTIVLTFGTDSSLQTTVGWDNVTGLGTPNGKAFADFFNPAR
jgi:subtilase family serine protease